MFAALPSDHDDHDGRPLRALPLALGHGTGSELRRPLGIAVAGGLILSQILTLYTTPVIYLFLDRLRLRFQSHGNANGLVPHRGTI